MDNEELVTAIRNGADYQNNMERLYLQNKAIMFKTARRYEAFADIDDLMQEAYFALDNAVNMYDNTCGAKFTTYLVYHLKGTFFRFIIVDRLSCFLIYDVAVVLVLLFFADVNGDSFFALFDSD